MGKFKKRVTGTHESVTDTFDAIKFDGTLSCWKEIKSAFPNIKTGGISYNEATNEIYVLNIVNSDGNHSISAGDYIVGDNKGAYFPCKPDGFNKTFEPAEKATDNDRIMFNIDPIFSLL